MKRSVHPVTFERGMRADLSPARQPAGTYRNSIGMGLRFQPAGGGEAMNLSAYYGSEDIGSIPAGFRIVGAIEIFLSKRPYLFLCITDGTTSQFGLSDIPSRLTPFDPLVDVKVDAPFVMLFTDDHDSNQERIGWRMGNKLRVTMEAETGNRVRIIVNDRLSEPLFIPLHLGFSNPNTLQPWPTFEGADGGDNVPYPRYWSVHAFRQQPEVRFDRIIFQGRVPGSLPSGSYRYSYRYLLTPSGIPEEVVSVCYPPMPPHVLPEGTPGTDNHHKIFLREAGVPTKHGLSFNVENPDKRWSRIELLASYSADGETWGPWVVADAQDNPIGEFVALSHTQSGGRGKYLPEGEIAAQWQVIRAAQDVATFDNLLWILGPKVGSGDPGQNINGHIAQLVPRYRRMDMDAKRAVRFFTEAEVLTDTPARTTTIQEKQYRRADGTIATKSVPIRNDHVNYKGIQFIARYAALRHQEKYRIGMVLVDDKGQPAFVIPLGVFQAPALGTNNNFLTAYDAATDTYFLNALGITVNNVRIPRNVIFDENGKQRITGIMLVRSRAEGAILHQGVITNLVRQSRNTDDEDRISVMPTFSNYGGDDESGGVQQVNGLVYIYQDEPKAKSAGQAMMQSGYVSYISGDVMMEQNLVANKRTDSVEIVGSAHPVYQPGSNGGIAGPIHLVGANDHTYTKNYQMQTDPARPTARGRSWTGAKSEVSSSMTVDFWGRDTKELALTFDPEAPNLSFNGYSAAWVQQPDNIVHCTFKDGYVAKGTVALRVPGLTFVDAGRSQRDPAGVQIVNYRREVQPVPENLVDYQTTGHFLRLTPAVLAELPQENGSFIFSDMDLDGGDTYPSPVDFLRIYPERVSDERRQPYSNNPQGGENNNTGEDYPDYAVGMIVPLECKYNLWLRAGRKFAESASMPTALSRGITNLRQFAKSVNHQQSEYWNVSAATRVGRETIKTFRIRPADSRIDSERIFDTLWSEVSTDGEVISRMRRMPPLNYSSVEAEYGPPVSFAKQFLYLYVKQPDAIGRLRINERSQVVDESGKNLLLGQGRTMAGIDYVIKEAGSSKWEDHWLSPKALYWIDRRRGKLHRLSQAGVDVLSDRDGFHDMVTALLSEPGSPLLPGSRPVSGEYDPINARVLISFWDRTMVYNEDLNSFELISGEIPDHYHQMGGSLIMQKPNTNRLFRVGTGRSGYVFGERNEISVEVIVNPIPTKSSTFNEMWMSMPAEAVAALTRIDLSTLTQQQQILPLSDPRVEYMEGRLHVFLRTEEVPGADGEPVEVFERLRGNYLRMVLTFNPALTEKVIYLQSLEVGYRLSAPY